MRPVDRRLSGVQSSEFELFCRLFSPTLKCGRVGVFSQNFAAVPSAPSVVDFVSLNILVSDQV